MKLTSIIEYEGPLTEGDVTFTGNITIAGNLTVTGTTTAVVNQTTTGTVTVTVTNAAALTVENATGTDVVVVNTTTPGITVTGDVTISGDVAVNGGDITTTAATFNLLNATATTVNAFGAATVVGLGAASIVVTLGSNATINGGAAANDDLTLQGTTHATRTTSYVILQPNGGDVGIGTAAPGSKLEVAAGTVNGAIALFKGAFNGTALGDGPSLSIHNTNATTNNRANIGFYDGATTASAWLEVTFVDRTNHYGDFSFVTKDADGYVPRLYIKSGGTVGIGTTAPDRLLHPELADAATATVSFPFRITHITSGVPANSIGVGMEFEQETAANNNEIIATIEAVVTDVTATSEDADIVVKLMAAGAAAAEVLRIASTGNVTVAGDLAVNGGDVTSTATTFNLLNATVTTLNLGGASTTIEIGAATGTISVNNALTVDLTLAVTGNTTLTGDLAVNGGDITTTAVTMNVFNATATTVNAFGAATVIGLGAASTVITLGSNATINGGAAANDDLTLQGTSHATRTTSYVILQPNGGNVGIGTTSPNRKVEFSINEEAHTPALRLTNLSVNAYAAELEWYSGAGPKVTALMGSTASDTQGGEWYLDIRDHSTNALVRRMYIDKNGRIGIGTMTPDRLLQPELADGATVTVTYPFRLTHITSGTPANSIGVGLEFEQETSADNNEIIATIEAVVTDVTATSEDADLVIKLMTAGAAAAEVLRIASTGNVTVAGDLAVNGGDVTSTATTFNLLNATVTTLNLGGASTTVEIGAATGTTSINNALTVDLTLAVTGNTTLTGDLAVNGGDLTSTATTFNLLNATVTTLNLGGAATTVEVGAATGTTSVNNALTVDLTLAITGNTTLTGDLAVNGGDITTTAVTMNVFNATATTVNAFGAATSIVMGADGVSLDLGRQLLVDEAAAILQLGTDSATPTAQTFKGPDGSGTDIAGANLTIAGGRGTGTGAGGSVIISTAPAGLTGSSQNALVAALTINSAALFTFADGANFAFNATTGTKIGTATTQKIAFYNAVPIVQGTSVADATGGATIDAEARTAVNAVISRLEALGLIATV